MKNKTLEQRSERILAQLRMKYPEKKSYDLDGRGMHFVCEVEPVEDHPESDRAVEVIIFSKPHKHIKMTQHYTVLSGNLEFHVGNDIMMLHPGDTYVVKPNNVHWAKSSDECCVELYSEPGWTKEDHILVNPSM